MKDVLSVSQSLRHTQANASGVKEYNVTAASHREKKNVSTIRPPLGPRATDFEVSGEASS